MSDVIKLVEDDPECFEDTLRRLHEASPKEMVAIYIDEEGVLSIISTPMQNQTILWLIEQAKLGILEVGDRALDFVPPPVS